MEKIITACILVVQLLQIVGCNGQTKQNNQPQNKPTLIGGKFENREFTYYGIPKVVSSTDTSSGWNEGQKLLLTGIVYKIDGRTPAPNVLLYYYQTNTTGRYVHKADESRSMPPNDLGQTHGYIRGWVKTDSSGKYFRSCSPWAEHHNLN